MFGTVSLSSLTAIVKPYVLFARAMWMKGSYVMSQKYLISGSTRQYHSYFCSYSCL